MAPHDYLELRPRNGDYREATASGEHFIATNVSYDPIEPARIRRKPLSTNSSATLEEPLLLEDSVFRREESTDQGLVNDNRPPIQSHYSSGQESYAKDSNFESRGVAKPITRNGLRRYINGWLVHIPALASTAVAIWVSIEKWYWFPESGPWPDQGIGADVISNFLQFAAKLHELLIVASLSSIAIAMVRRRLVGHGVRLGFLTGGYRVGDLKYLASSPFRHQGFKNLDAWEFVLAAYLVFATVMSTIVGPASAVLLVPSPGWFPMNHEQAFINIDMPIFYDATPATVWPELLENPSTLSNISECQYTEGTYQSWCPAGGFSEIWNWAASFDATDLKNNLTFQFPSTDLTRDLVHTEANNIQKTALSTTPSYFFMITFGLVQKYIDRVDVGLAHDSPRYRLKARLVTRAETRDREKDQPIYQPFVQSKCKVYRKMAARFTDTELVYPTDALSCFGDKECQELKNDPPKLYRDWWDNPEDENSTIIGSFHTNGDESSSVVLVAGQVPDPSLYAREKDIVFACSLFAHWATSNFSLDPKFTDVLDSSLNGEKQMLSIFNQEHLGNGRVIRFHEGWFKYLDPEFNTSTRLPAQNPTSAILQLVDLFSGLGPETTKHAVLPIT